ncbi:hypothetical protein ABIE21_003287 [Conyzicola nivalis]|uniref:Uncharacterized protein n=1 Tax=Conyzicola nivalis TaxID=1477021 RepID=A0ABV2QRR9_9MICO
MNSPTEPTGAATRALLAAAVGERLTEIDFKRAGELYATPEALAARMLEALPDTPVTDPPIGSCYSAPALARWKQLSRQAIDQQRKAGRLFGAMVDRRWLFPAVQFDKCGRQSRAFAELLYSHPGQDPGRVRSLARDRGSCDGRLTASRAAAGAGYTHPG